MRVAFDIGGTFTDVVVLQDDKQVQFTKVLSLIDQVGEDIVACIERLKSTESVDHFVHATTTASNAVIEGKTSKTGLLTTRGFKDVLELMNQKGNRWLDPRWTRLPPLVSRRLRVEVNERITADGSVERPLDLEDAKCAIMELRDAGVEAIAVCLINSYVNPVHERALAGLVRDLAPNVRLSLSSDVNPEGREYERTSTTAINASLLPVVNSYLDRLEKHLGKYSSRLLIMQSNGGIMTSAMARARPIAMVESGPAAGVLAAARFANEQNFKNALSFDMGGTTAKACLVLDGRPMEKAAGEIGASVSAVRVRGTGHALRVPSVDIVEVGAGGGSMVWIDEVGALRVGPISAGADPGPVCYGRGGKAATVTDANVALGNR